MSELSSETAPQSQPLSHAHTLVAFDALEPGAGLELSSDRYPKTLLDEFQAHRAGYFDWNVLEMGPTRFRVEVRRRTTEGQRNVTEYLEGDHRRLDTILGDVERLSEAGHFAAASARFAEFSCGLDRHIEIEERVLFPVFEQLTSMETGPTSAMRDEHAGIRELLMRVSAGLTACNPVAAVTALHALEDLLSRHNMKEERVLYPMTDRAAGDARRQHELVERMQAF